MDFSATHERHVKALTNAWDWSGLLRYWASHEHSDALNEALYLVTDMKNRLNCPLYQCSLETLLQAILYGIADSSEEAIASIESSSDWLEDLDDEEERSTAQAVQLVSISRMLIRRAVSVRGDLQTSILTEALGHLERARVVAENLGDDAVVAKVLVVMGPVYAQAGDRDRGILALKMAGQLYKKIGEMMRALGRLQEAKLYDAYGQEAGESLKSIERQPLTAVEQLLNNPGTTKLTVYNRRPGEWSLGDLQPSELVLSDGLAGWGAEVGKSESKRVCELEAAFTDLEAEVKDDDYAGRQVFGNLVTGQHRPLG